MKLLIFVLLLIAISGGVYLYNILVSSDDPVGGYLGPSSDLVGSQVSCGGSLSGATTSVWASGSNPKNGALVDNIGVGEVYIAFGADATTIAGFRLSPVNTSNTRAYADIKDPNLFLKAANCVATVTSTLNIFRY